jgi:hypothetical protein
MAQITINTHIKQGKLQLDNLPFPDNTKVKVVMIPNLDIDLEKKWFFQIQALTQSDQGNWSEDIIQERHSFVGRCVTCHYQISVV